MLACIPGGLVKTILSIFLLLCDTVTVYLFLWLHICRLSSTDLASEFVFFISRYWWWSDIALFSVVDEEEIGYSKWLTSDGIDPQRFYTTHLSWLRGQLAKPGLPDSHKTCMHVTVWILSVTYWQVLVYTWDMLLTGTGYVRCTGLKDCSVDWNDACRRYRLIAW